MNWKLLFSRSAGARPDPQLTPELRARIQSSFDEASKDEEHFPSTIDPRIYHVKLIGEHLGDLRGRRVLDVGCGKGRFARVFHERQPEAELWGLDISEEMLRPGSAPDTDVQTNTRPTDSTSESAASYRIVFS